MIPPTARAPWCAAESTPRARPLTTTTPRARKVGTEPFGHAQRIGRTGARADDGHREAGEHVDVAGDPEDRRRIGDVDQRGRIAFIADRDDRESSRHAVADSLNRPCAAAGRVSPLRRPVPAALAIGAVGPQDIDGMLAGAQLLGYGAPPPDWQ